MRFFLLIINLLFTSFLFAQIEDPVSWSFQSKDLGNGEFDLIATADIENGWYIYSQNLEDDGPVPTTFEFEPRKSRYSLVGNTKEEGDFIEGFDKLFEMQVKKFKKKADFTQRVKLSKKGTKITGYLTFMTCNNEKCLPPQDIDFSYVLKVGQTTNANTTSKAVSTPKSKVVKSEVKTEKKAPVKKDKKVNTDNDAGLSIASADANQGILDPVSWSMRSVKTGENTFDLFFNATIEDGWYIYSQDVDDSGPVPTAIEFTENKKVNFLSEKPLETSDHVKEGFDKLFDMDIKKFAKAAEYKMSIKVKGEKEKLAGYLVFMTCDNEKCLPPEEIEFEFDLSKEEIIDLGFVPAGDLPTGEGSKYKIESIDINNPINDCGTEEEKEGESIWLTLVLGFLGGLVALLTPCVFPMIPLTVSFFTKGSDNRTRGIINAILYGLFIFFIYFLLSIPFHLFESIAPDIFNQISTHPVLNIIFFVIFLVFAISFFGYFEITLPSGIANKADSASNIGGLLGIFFMALTLAIVSFSCTGPILGSILAKTAAESTNINVPMHLTAAMSGFGLALGIPFAIFALFPGMLNSLPKSGGWLNTVKVVLGFVELALAIKFLSNADLVMNWGLLPREIFFGLWILIGLGLAAYLFGLIKFPHDSPIKKFSLPRIGFGVLTIAFVIYLLPGLTNTKYANRQLLSGFPPPLFYSLYEKKSNCPLDLECYKDYEKGLAVAKKKNKPILLDFTGWACVNCRKMEENVWIKPEIFDKLSEDFILISLYVDDKRELPKDKIEEYVSSKGRVQKIDTKGEVWATMQTETFINNSQPWYAVLSPDELLLNSPVGYQPNVSEYSDFLDCGLDAFDQLEQMQPNERKKLKQKFATVLQ